MMDVGDMMLLRIEVGPACGGDGGHDLRINDIEFFLQMAKVFLGIPPKGDVIAKTRYPRISSGEKLATMDADPVDLFIEDILVSFLDMA